MPLQIQLRPDADIIQQQKNRLRHLLILPKKHLLVTCVLKELEYQSLLCLLTPALHYG